MADMDGVEFEDNSEEILRMFAKVRSDALDLMGQKAVGYAKKLCPVGNVDSVGGWAKNNKSGKAVYRGGTLRNSITYEVSGDELLIGSNVEYAPYVELGTGPHFKPPPEWEQFDAPRGKGIGHSYVKPRPFLRPAIEDHKREYEDIFRRVIEGKIKR